MTAISINAQSQWDSRDDGTVSVAITGGVLNLGQVPSHYVVTVEGDAVVHASTGVITAYDEARLHLTGTAVGSAYGRAIIKATGDNRAYGREHATIILAGKASGVVEGEAVCYAARYTRVTANGNSTVYATGDTLVEGWNQAKVRAYENARVKAFDQCAADLHDYASCVYENVEPTVNGNATATRIKPVPQNLDGLKMVGFLIEGDHVIGWSPHKKRPASGMPLHPTVVAAMANCRDSDGLVSLVKVRKEDISVWPHRGIAYLTYRKGKTLRTQDYTGRVLV